MAAKRKATKGAAKAGSAVAAARTSPYVQRLVEDESLRENIRVAYESARDAYGRLNNGKAPQKVVLDDKKFHKDLQRSAEALREASNALREKPGKRRAKRGGSGLGKLLLVGIVGAVAAVALSEDLRNKVLDLLFGAEEEFDYASTTTPAGAPPPAEKVSAQ